MSYDLQRIKDSVVYESVANTHHTKDQWEQLAKEFFKAQLSQNPASVQVNKKSKGKSAESKKFSSDEGFHEVVEQEEIVTPPKLYFPVVSDKITAVIQPVALVNQKFAPIESTVRKPQQKQTELNRMKPSTTQLDPEEMAFLNYLKARSDLIAKFGIQLPTDLQQRLVEISTANVSPPQVINFRAVSPGTESFDSGGSERNSDLFNRARQKSLSSTMSSVNSSPVHSGCDRLCSQHLKILEEIQLQLDREAEWKQLQKPLRVPESDCESEKNLLLQRSKSMGSITDNLQENQKKTIGRSTHNLDNTDSDQLTPRNATINDTVGVVTSRNNFKDFLHSYKQAIKPAEPKNRLTELPAANRRRVEYVPIMTRITKEMEELEQREAELRARRTIHFNS